MPIIRVPLHIRFIQRTHIFDVISVVPKVLHTTNQEACEIIKLVMLEIDTLVVGGQCSTRSGHKIGRRVGKEEKIIHPPLPCGIHKPLLTGLFGEVIGPIGGEETFSSVPCTCDLIVLPIFITSGANIHSPIR